MPIFSPDISEEAKDLIKMLLQKDFKSRLGFKNDAVDIMQHPFFDDIKFHKLFKKKIKPKYKPEIKPLDIGSIVSYRESHVSIEMLKAHQEQFKGLTKL